MSEENQIKEMACAICGNNKICVGQGVDKCILHPQMRRYANNAYREGYRKQSEGKWKQVCGDLGWVEMECSVCKYSDVFDDHKEFHKYCPNCGAHMRKEDEGK